MCVQLDNVKQRAKNIFKVLLDNNPNPKTDLVYINAYTFCVAVMLSAQATDKSVNIATSNLFKCVKNPSEMIELGEIRLKDFIRSIGLFNNKAKNIIAMSKILVEKFNSIVPRNRDELATLPGIGRKSANVIANILFNEPYIAVDTHVLRVSNRLGFTTSKNPLVVEKDLIDIIPSEYHINAGNLLVLYGRYVCTAKKPKCTSGCLINKFCPIGINLLLKDTIS